MKLVKAHVTNFRSIEDSNEIQIGDLTCLVGKNEAGKTGILSAIYGANPHKKFKYVAVDDYPRRFYTKFKERHPEGKSPVIQLHWKLEPKDLVPIVVKFGRSSFESDELVTTHGFGYDEWVWDFEVSSRACLDFRMDVHKLEEVEKASLKDAEDCESAIAALNALPQRSAKLDALLAELRTYEDGFWGAVTDLLKPPKFFYTSHFERMSGTISVNKLNQDRQAGKVEPGDQIFLDFLEYAGTTVEELRTATNTKALRATLEAASNDITKEIFDFWTQNDALEIWIEIAEGKAGDPPPFNTGTVVDISIHNKNHQATVQLSERSAGFIWFFSFLAQFKQLQKTTGNAVLLLDEPGLTLHGKAQSDLLRYIKERLLPKHQVVYTTHSPFMIPPDQLETVRVVEDRVTYDDRHRPTVFGTKVRSDVLEVDKDTLFPLQGALGYEISQTLFVGKNVLLVEGPGDIVFIEACSRALRKRKRPGIDTRWTMCPSGGIDKISPFVSLFGGNKLNIAVLCDIEPGQKGKIDRLRKDILKAGQLFTTNDFSGKKESDIEDFFHPALYAEILNRAFDLPDALKLDEKRLLAADSKTERLLKKAEAAFKVMPAGTVEFDHYTPAEWLLRNPEFLDSDTDPIKDTLKTFESAIAEINKLLQSK